MNIQVEDKRERGSVEVSNTPTVEVSSRAAERTTVEADVEVSNVEAEAKSGVRIPVAEGRVSLFAALSARCSSEVDILSFLCSDSHKEVVMKIRTTTNPS